MQIGQLQYCCGVQVVYDLGATEVTSGDENEIPICEFKEELKDMQKEVLDNLGSGPTMQLLALNGDQHKAYHKALTSLGYNVVHEGYHHSHKSTIYLYVWQAVNNSKEAEAARREADEKREAEEEKLEAELQKQQDKVRARRHSAPVLRIDPNPPAGQTFVHWAGGISATGGARGKAQRARPSQVTQGNHTPNQPGGNTDSGRQKPAPTRPRRNHRRPRRTA